MVRAFVASTAALVVVIALLELAPGSVAGQAPAATAHTETEAKTGPVWAARRDPRVTRVGALLRY